MSTLRTLQSLVDPPRAPADQICMLALHSEGATSWSYGEVASHVQRLAQGLVRAGMRPGEYVALLASNRPEWVIVCLAVIKAGAAIMPLDTQIGNEALAHILQDSEARFIFTTTEYTNRLKRLNLPSDRRAILLDVAAEDERGWRSLLANTPGPLPTVEPTSPAALFYTSGTTGVPKGVSLTHRNLVFQLEAVLETDLLKDDDRVLLPLPMYHVYPFTVGTLIPLAAGLPLVLPFALTGPQILRALQEGKPTIIIGVPRLYRALYTGIETQFHSRGQTIATMFERGLKLSIWLNQQTGWQIGKLLFGPVHRRFGPQLRLLTSGGSALDPELAWKLAGLGWQIAIGYGLTETSPLLTINMPGTRKLDSAGCALPGVELRIDTDVSTEESAPQAEQESGSAPQQGEILARGPAVFRGYRNLPDQTSQAFTPDGWFRTGDLGYFDADDYLYISGRASTLIVTEGGKNIQPEPVEETYQQHSFIQEIGILQRDNGLVALIVPEMDEVNRRSNGDVEYAIREAVTEQSRLVPSYQRISDYAISYEPLPKTNLGKIRRHLLAEQYDLAKRGELQQGVADVGPVAVEDMSEQDRLLLDRPAARQVWDWLANRYADRRLTPDTSPQLDLGIDSLAWLNLSLDISQQTGVELNEEAIRRISTVRDLLREVANTAEGSSTAPLSLLDNPEAMLTDEQQQWFAPPGPLLSVLSVLLYVLVRTLGRVLFRVQARGLEHLPEQGPFVLAPNHTSYLDAPIIAAVLSYTQMRQIYWAGSVDVMFKHPAMRLISRLSQTMPVAGAETGTGRASLAVAAVTLKRKKNLVWFPEGQRSPRGKLLPFRQGLGILLDQYTVPVVPVYIEGAYEALPMGRLLPRLHKVTVTFGPPCDPQELAREGRGEHPPARIVQALHRRVAELTSQQ